LILHPYAIWNVYSIRGKQGGLAPLFACWGKLPQTPLNDFCKIGCAPFRRFSENDTIRNTPATTGQGIGFASHSADLADVRGRVFEQSRGAKPLYFYRA